MIGGILFDIVKAGVAATSLPPSVQARVNSSL